MQLPVTSNYVEIAFGHCSSHGKPLPPCLIAAIEELALLALLWYIPGAQVYHPRGGYRSKNGYPMIEKSTVIKGYTLNDVTCHLTELLKLAGMIATVLEQESVLVNVNGTLHWVERIQ